MESGGCCAIYATIGGQGGRAVNRSITIRYSAAETGALVLIFNRQAKEKCTREAE